MPKQVKPWPHKRREQKTGDIINDISDDLREIIEKCNNKSVDFLFLISKKSNATDKPVTYVTTGGNVENIADVAMGMSRRHTPFSF